MRTIFFIILVIFIVYVIYTKYFNNENEKKQPNKLDSTGLPEINQSLNKDIVYYRQTGDCGFYVDADVSKINEIKNIVEGYTGTNWASKYKSNLSGSWRHRFEFSISKTFCKNKTIQELTKLINTFKAVQNPKI